SAEPSARVAGHHIYRHAPRPAESLAVGMGLQRAAREGRRLICLREHGGGDDWVGAGRADRPASSEPREMIARSRQRVRRAIESSYVLHAIRRVTGGSVLFHAIVAGACWLRR